jgi:uncharacterized membrane protein
VITFLILIGVGIVVGIILTPLADWLASLIQQFVSTTIVTPFVATIWTLVYYRLLAQKQEEPAPGPEAEPAT